MLKVVESLWEPHPRCRLFGLCSNDNTAWARPVASRHQGRKPGTKCGGRPVRGGLGDRSLQWVQGRSPGRRSGGRSPPEAEAILDFYMHNFDLILNYFCFARAGG